MPSPYGLKISRIDPGAATSYAFVMPFRLRRSLLFWTGLFGALFLAAAWLDSHRHTSSLTGQNRVYEQVGVFSRRCCAGIKIRRALSARVPDYSMTWTALHQDAAAADVAAGYFPPPFLKWKTQIRAQLLDPRSGANFGPTTTTVAFDLDGQYLLVPYWLILAVYLPAWLLPLILRARRQNAHAAALAAQNAHP